MTEFHVTDITNPMIEIPMTKTIDMTRMFEKKLLVKRAIAAAAR
jgi:hypothetical protein